VGVIPGNRGTSRAWAEPVLLRLDRVEPDLLQVVDRGTEPDRLGERRRARLELAGSSPRRLLVADRADHVPAEQERLHVEQELRPAPEEADAARAEHLVAGDGDEVGAERLDVQPDVRCGLRRVARQDRAALVRPRREPLRVADRAERVGDDVRGDDFTFSRSATSSRSRSPLSSSG
jgi:hypothetical protein